MATSTAELKAVASAAEPRRVVERFARRLGVLGGTFNPPHLGHVALARAAAEELGLEQVLLVPAHLAPHKPAVADAGAAHRLGMCRLAAAQEPRLSVSELELDRPAPSYTVDTLRAIHANHPDVELTLIVGADMALSLPSWREPREVLRLARLAVAHRQATGSRAVLGALAGLDGDRRVAFLHMEPVEISSSLVREHVAAGEPVERLVGLEVAAYIARHGLYRAGAKAAPRDGHQGREEGGERQGRQEGRERQEGQEGQGRQEGRADTDGARA